MSMKHIDIYTDGSCSGNPGPGGWASILVYRDNIKEISGGSEHTTNNKMELTAVIKGLSELKECCTVNIITDSKYVSDAINKGWLDKWIKTGFKGKRNIELWKELYELTLIHDVEFTWVKGHAGHEFNERCDKLARYETKKFK